MVRALALRKLATAIQQASGEPPPADDGLKPGCMKLYSFYAPSLEGGQYAIEAVQIVEAQSGKQFHVYNYTGPVPDPYAVPDPKAILQQNFEVMAPQFSIDPSKINSFYPPNGHSDEGRILPHMVFNDPHLPWVRLAGTSDGLEDSPDGKNQVPWCAVVVFDPSELVITSTEAQTLGLSVATSDHPDTTTLYDPLKLPPPGAFPMKVSQYLNTVKSNVPYGTVDDSTAREVTNVIFPTKTRIAQLFGDHSDTDFSILQRYKYLAHVRHVDTLGFPDAGVEEEGYFSICVSATMGDFKTTMPKTQIAHLVSIEHLDKVVSGLTSPSTDRIGLISLYSWTYTIIPEGPSFVDEMQHLASTVQMLKPSIPVLQSLSDSTASQTEPNFKTAAILLHQRLDRGFTINRWRTATGEETVAFNRGPLTPSLVPQHPADPANPSADDWVGMSMHGKEFQIWDVECGVMDLTYSNAWNLGRIASISDGPFNAALLRFRSYVWKWASSSTRNAANGVVPRREVVTRLTSLISSLHEVQPAKFQGDVSRINPAVQDDVAPALSHPTVAPIFARAVRAEVDKATSAGQEIYNDFSKDKAASADWVTIFNWVLDALFLAKIPAHYLFTDPSHVKGAPVLNALPGTPALPPEALRFFHIDDTWMDCFIDGALSVANHLEPEFDRTRIRIKEVFNLYFQNKVANTDMKPIIPRSGFILQSAVVRSTPDLRITASTGAWDDKNQKWAESPNKNNPIIRLTRLDDYTIICLFECALAEIWQIKLAQPPHQQRFAIGSGIDLDESGKHYTVPFEARRLYTQNAPDGPNPEDREWKTTSFQGVKFFDPDTRCIDPEQIVTSVYAQLKHFSDFDEDKFTSAELGIELNDPSYQLDMMGPLPAPTSKDQMFAPYTRQLWIKPDQDPLFNTPGHDISAPHNPSAAIMPAQGTGSTREAAASKSVVIALPPKNNDFTHPSISPGPQAHTSRVITMGRPTISAPPSQALLPVPQKPQYQAIVCVDYRPTPPMPGMLRGAPVYAPNDYIPVGTKTLLDLMIVVVRINFNDAPRYALARIDIELPVSGSADNDKTTEPLLTSDPYIGHARMARNLHFVPTLYNSKDKFGAKPVLGIRLLPRSGRPDASIPLTTDRKSFDATVRLPTCRIAKTVKRLKMMVATAPNVQSQLPRGVCTALLRETYATGVPSSPFAIQQTQFTVLKNDYQPGTEKDINGNVVDI